MESECSRVCTIDHYAAACTSVNFEQPENALENRAFACTSSTNDANLHARLQGKRKLLESKVHVFSVAYVHTFELNCPLSWWPVPSAFVCLLNEQIFLG